MLAVIMVKFSSSKVGIVHKYHNHGTLIELVWTITPALILVAIAFPSFKLLYLMDSFWGVNDLYTIHLMAAIPVKQLSSKCTALVPFGQTSSTVSINYNRRVRDLTAFPSWVISQLVGHLLGDGALVRTQTSITPAFIFTQTVKRFEYAWFVFLQLIHYCVRYPRLNVSTRHGVKYPFMQVSTRSYPILLTLYNLFYPIINGQRVKLITLDLLPYLDNIALAY